VAADLMMRQPARSNGHKSCRASCPQPVSLLIPCGGIGYVMHGSRVSKGLSGQPRLLDSGAHPGQVDDLSTLN